MPLTIKIKDAETAIKNISKERNPEVYGRIKDEDLLAKEFHYHSHYQAMDKLTERRL